MVQLFSRRYTSSAQPLEYARCSPAWAVYRVVRLSVAVLVVLSGAMLAAEKTPYTSLAGLAGALSQNDADGALEFFDSTMPSFADIEQKVEALTAQDDISCSIDVVTDTPVNGVHKLDLDWFMQIKSQGDSEQIERRRERVEVEMRQIKGTWKITSMAPIDVFNPIRIQ